MASCCNNMLWLRETWLVPSLCFLPSHASHSFLAKLLKEISNGNYKDMMSPKFPIFKRGVAEVKLELAHWGMLCHQDLWKEGQKCIRVNKIKTVCFWINPPHRKLQNSNKLNCDLFSHFSISGFIFPNFFINMKNFGASRK